LPTAIPIDLRIYKRIPTIRVPIIRTQIKVIKNYRDFNSLKVGPLENTKLIPSIKTTSEGLRRYITTPAVGIPVRFL